MRRYKVSLVVKGEGKGGAVTGSNPVTNKN